MRGALYRIMSKPWVYRITCGVLFVATMATIRWGLIQLRDTHDKPLIAAVCLPIGVACLAFGYWYDRRGY